MSTLWVSDRGGVTEVQGPVGDFGVNFLQRPADEGRHGFGRSHAGIAHQVCGLLQHLPVVILLREEKASRGSAIGISEFGSAVQHIIIIIIIRAVRQNCVLKQRCNHHCDVCGAAGGARRTLTSTWVVVSTKPPKRTLEEKKRFVTFTSTCTKRCVAVSC